MIYLLGSTSISVDIMIVDDSGLPVTGLVAATFPTLTYSLAGPNADVAFPALSDLATITTAYSSGGVKERGNGYYRLDVPNGAFTTGGVVTIRGEATGKHVLCERLHLVAYNPQDAVHLGLSALPNTAVTTNGSLLTSGTGTDQLSVSAGKVLLQATQTGVTIPTVTTVTNQLTAAQVATGVWQDATAGDFTAASSIGKSLYTSGNAPGAASGLALVGSNMGTVSSVTGSVASVTGNVGGNVVGSVASVTAGVTLAAGAVNAAAYGTDSGNAPIRTGTAQAGAASSITLDAGADSTHNSFYNGCPVVLTGGTGVGQVRVIVGYVAATRVATVDSNWGVNPDATTTFTVLPCRAAAVNGTAQVSVAAITSGAITAASITAGALNGKGDWLLASNYTTPPTTAQIATAIWTDTTGSDFTTTSSPGKILVTQLGGTFTTTSSSVFTVNALANAPGGSTPAAIATAVWQDLTSSSDFTTAGSIGALLVANINATISSRMAAGNVTVGGYSSGQDPYSLVMKVAMTENYAAKGVAPTMEQATFRVMQNLCEFAIVSTTIHAKKLDQSTDAETYTLNDQSNPTLRTRAT